MKEFDVKITETLERTVTVKADTQEDAEIMVHDQHSQGDHVLDVGDYKGVSFQVTNEREIELDVLLVEPMKPPVVVQVFDTLQAFQYFIDGTIEAAHPFDDPVVLIGKKEAMLNNLQLNRGIYDDKGELQDIISGTFLIAGAGEENFESLSPELTQKYKDLFATPEKFYFLAGKVIAQKVEPPKEKDVTPKVTNQER